MARTHFPGRKIQNVFVRMFRATNTYNQRPPWTRPRSAYICMQAMYKRWKACVSVCVCECEFGDNQALPYHTHTHKITYLFLPIFSTQYTQHSVCSANFSNIHTIWWTFFPFQVAICISFWKLSKRVDIESNSLLQAANGILLFFRCWFAVVSNQVLRMFSSSFVCRLYRLSYNMVMKMLKMTACHLNFFRT